MCGEVLQKWIAMEPQININVDDRKATNQANVAIVLNFLERRILYVKSDANNAGFSVDGVDGAGVFFVNSVFVTSTLSSPANS